MIEPSNHILDLLTGKDKLPGYSKPAGIVIENQKHDFDLLLANLSAGIVSGDSFLNQLLENNTGSGSILPGRESRSNVDDVTLEMLSGSGVNLEGWETNLDPGALSRIGMITSPESGSSVKSDVAGQVNIVDDSMVKMYITVSGANEKVVDVQSALPGTGEFLSGVPAGERWLSNYPVIPEDGSIKLVAIQSIGFQEASDKNRDGKMELGLAFTGERFNRLTNDQTHEIIPGRYRVLESKIDNAGLHLTITGDNGQSDLLKVSVPEATLKDIFDRNPGTSDARPHPTGDGWRGEESNLEWYRSRLNLTEIEIVTVEKTSNGKTIPKPDIREFFVNENDPGMIVPDKTAGKDQQLDQNTRGSKGRAKIENKGFIEEAVMSESISTESVEEEVAHRPRHVSNNNNNRIQYRFQGFTDLSGEGKSDGSNESSMGLKKTGGWGVFEKIDTGPDTGERRTDLPQVRFTLPENIKTGLKPYGRTVMIRMEPVHLGPARLSLTMYDDKLQARLVVRDSLARMTIESSMDRLVDQLSRAGIEVDHIEVTVGGENARNGLFERQTHRFLGSGNRGKLKFKKVVNPDHRVTSTISAPPRPSYVGAGGVNVLA